MPKRSFLTMLEAQTRNAQNAPLGGVAIQFSSVGKRYRLYANQLDLALEVLGVKLPFSRREIREFYALQDINLEIARGEQVGVIGRNGAGKTTLLKLVTGNFAPTRGRVSVYGSVQALMHVGLGFHPEFTGYENLRSSLLYNGLDACAMDAALADAVEFAELGEFLHQPFKSYSLGMRSRLQFAAATAISPDILIVDEVLGAGDAYFSGKSATRMKQLTSSGCTLLLVSHSMQQVLQFCRRCIWMESGKVAMDGEALAVVRAYEEYSRRLESEAIAARAQGSESILADEGARARLLDTVRSGSAKSDDGASELDVTQASRWPSGARGLRIARIRLLDSRGVASRSVRGLDPAALELDIVASASGLYRVRYAVVIYREDGLVATRLISDYFNIECVAGETHTARAEVQNFQLGGGRYFMSLAIYKELDLENATDAVTYDLVSRCFQFTVKPVYTDDASLFHQVHQWRTMPTANSS